MDRKTVRAEQNRTARTEASVRTDEQAGKLHMLHARSHPLDRILLVSESIDTESTPSMPDL